MELLRKLGRTDEDELPHVHAAYPTTDDVSLPSL